MTRRRGPLTLPLVALLLSLLIGAGHAASLTGFTAVAPVARAYHTLLDADFDALPSVLAAACGRAPREACDTLRLAGLSWRIALDPDDRSLDAEFTAAADLALRTTEAWTRRAPDRAEAWFYHGAAYGARVQWRVLRGERLAAARDGKQVKESLEHALTLDPGMQDAAFGVGVYRYYAAVAPAAVRMLRWLLVLPGGDRADGLRQMRAAGEHGLLVRGEADYQLHLAYLWYEHRVDEALALIDSLRARYPRNPLFHQARAEILHVYFHDQMASLRSWDDLRLRARAGLVNAPVLAAARARIEAAKLLDALEETDRAVDLLAQVIADRPSQPRAAVATASALLPPMRLRLSRAPYRMALEGWRAFQRGDHTHAAHALKQALIADPTNPVTRYRWAQVLLATHDDVGARAELERVIDRSLDAPPVTRAAALFDLATLLERARDLDRASAYYLEASRVFGADRALIDRAATRARALDGASRR